MMLQQLHQTYLLLDGRQPPRPLVREARARRSAIRRRLRGLLRVPALRVPAGVSHA
jgi:hypothetical protein